MYEIFMGIEVLVSMVIGIAIGFGLSYFISQRQSLRLKSELENQFELLASRVLEDKGQKINEQNSQTMGLILNPLKERLKDFEKKVEEVYGIERAERGSLRGEISRLMDLNFKMSTEAENLSRALKGDNKAQGNWGEMILENILDRSGLRKGEDYIVQGTDLGLQNDDGQNIRPDVIIHLPDGKHLILDSKVSLNAFEEYSRNENEDERKRWGNLHLESLKRHIDGLSAKKYQTSDKLITPDFVLLFMPIEPAFALAFRLNPDLLQYAWEKNIALVSPTTLLTTLRTVASIWKQEQRKKNAEEIAARGGALYDKFVGFVGDLEDLGRKLETTQKTHENVMKKLSQGSGNLLGQVDKLRELGARNTKRLELTEQDKSI